MDSMMSGAPSCYGYNKMNAGNAYPSWPSTFFGGAAPWNTESRTSWPSSNSFESTPSMWSNNWESRNNNFEGRFPSAGFEGRYPSSGFEGRFNMPLPSSWTEKVNPMTRHMPLPTEIRDVAFRPASMVEFWSLANPIQIHPMDGSRFLSLCFDVKGFKPEEVTVTVSLKERCFTVEAKHEVKDNKEHAVTRTYLRKFTIPAELCCDLTKCEKEIKSCFTADGLLVIEAALPRMTPEELNLYREKCLSSKAMTTGLCDTTHHGHGPYARSLPIKTIA